MTGGRVIPTNKPETFMGFCVNTLWKLHHKIALQSPKCGEMIAFRKIFEQIPPESPVDEASIENEIYQKKLSILYIPEAIIYNRGPENIPEFLQQRRRINAGHLWLKKKYRYKVSTSNNFRIARLIFKEHRNKKIIWVIGLMGLEFISRMFAIYDFYFLKKSYTIWPQIKTSKKP